MKVAPTAPTTDARTIEIPGSLRARLVHRSWSRYPLEACGLLLGRRDASRTRVERVRETRNLNTARARDRYEIDPAEQLEVHETAHAAGLDVVGVWHSHPDHPAVPSETDRAQAWEGWSYVIVSVQAGARSELRSWHLTAGRFEEEVVRS